MVNGHDGHEHVLWKFAFEHVRNRISREAARVAAPALQDHSDKSYLPQRIQLTSGPSCGHCFSALHQTKGSNLLCLTIVEYVKVLGLEISH